VKHLNDFLSGVTAEELRELLHYDPETGIFTWRADGGHWKRRPGKIAGWRDSTTQYWKIQLPYDKRAFLAHRLAWLYMTGEWPKGLIDHKDMDPTNNRFDNFRDADNGKNQAHRGLRPHNKSGATGVSWTGTGWYAECHLNGKSLRKYFRSKEDAIAFRDMAVEVIHAEYGVPSGSV
jgi:hypothetical protein